MGRISELAVNFEGDEQEYTEHELEEYMIKQIARFDKAQELVNKPTSSENKASMPNSSTKPILIDYDPPSDQQLSTAGILSNAPTIIVIDDDLLSSQPPPPPQSHTKKAPPAYMLRRKCLTLLAEIYQLLMKTRNLNEDERETTISKIKQWAILYRPYLGTSYFTNSCHVLAIHVPMYVRKYGGLLMFS